MHTDPEIIKNISRKLTKQDIVIFISLNGETKELVVAAKNCYDAEIGSILLTANNTSSLMNYCEIALVGFKSEGSYFPITKCAHACRCRLLHGFCWIPMRCV